MASQADAAEMEASRSAYRTSAGARIGAGIVAGALGGILMIGCMMIYASVTDAGATMPLKALGALVYGVEALVAGPTAMAVGVLIQLALSIVIGILFALFMSRETSTVAALFAGVVVGIALWAAMDLFVMPLANPTMAARIALMPFGYFAAHVAFGIGLAMTPALMRTFTKERHERVRVPTQQVLPI
jgi:uncharacterized membrane protein YagU involved in acid resistance